jgi:hypothetical protein
MKEYRVRWEIDVSANTALDAADFARTVMQDKASEAQFFEVLEVEDGDVVSVHSVYLGGKS